MLKDTGNFGYDDFIAFVRILRGRLCYAWGFRATPHGIAIYYKDAHKDFCCPPFRITPKDLPALEQAIADCEAAAKYHGAFGRLLWAARALNKQPRRDRLPPSSKTHSLFHALPP